MPAMIGHVTQERYDQFVSEGRELVEIQTRCQFDLGDRALELEPLQSWGGAHSAGSDEAWTVTASLQRYAEDIGVQYTSLKKYRWVSARWPKQRRRPGVCHSVHRILAEIPEEEKRWATIAKLPRDERTGEYR